MTFFLVACPTFDPTLAFNNQEMEGAQGRAGGSNSIKKIVNYTCNWNSRYMNIRLNAIFKDEKHDFFL